MLDARFDDGCCAAGLRVLTIYSLSSVGAKELAVTSVRALKHDALVAELQARGCEVAETEFTTNVVWLASAGGIEVYGKRRKQFEAASDRATLVDGSVIARSDIALFSWASDDSPIAASRRRCGQATKWSSSPRFR